MNTEIDSQVGDSFESKDVVTSSEKVRKKYPALQASIIVVILINLIFSIVLYNRYIELNGLLTKRINELEGKVSDMSVNVTQTLNEYRNLENIAIANSFEIERLLISQRISNSGVVTDQFFVDNAVFFESVAIIDIDTQPAMSYNYKGYGNFTTEDRELRKHLINLMEEIEKVYDSHKSTVIKKFNDLKVYITIKNYDIGTWENGTLKLVGE